MRCAGITKGGDRCRLQATHGSYCYQHSPEFADERKRRASRGGRTGGNGRRSGKGEIEQIKADIRDVIDAVAEGEQRNGAILFMGYHCLLRAAEAGRKIKETDELERRIEQLEAMDAEAGAGAGGTAWHR